MKGGSPPPRARAWEDARPLPVPRGGDGPGDLNLFESLGSGLASIVSDVESTLVGGLSVSATQLLPISEEGSRMCQASSASQNRARTDKPALLAHVHGRQPQGMTQVAPNSGMPFTTAGGGQNSPHRGQGSSSTLSARSLANTTVARFGGAADSYQLRGELGANDRKSNNSTPTVDVHRRAPHAGGALEAEQRMWNSLPAVADGAVKLRGRKDACDTATRSKIETWMSSAAPAPVDRSASEMLPDSVLARPAQEGGTWGLPQVPEAMQWLKIFQPTREAA